jgi:hypothetical protein
VVPNKNTSQLVTGDWRKSWEFLVILEKGLHYFDFSFIHVNTISLPAGKRSKTSVLGSWRTRKGGGEGIR